MFEKKNTFASFELLCDVKIEREDFLISAAPKELIDFDRLFALLEVLDPYIFLLARCGVVVRRAVNNRRRRENELEGGVRDNA